MDRFAGDHEGAFAAVVNGPRVFPGRIDPRFQYFEDEEVVFCHYARIDELAFKIGITFDDEWGFDSRGGRGREAKDTELVDLAS